MKTLKYHIFNFISYCVFIPLKLSSQSQVDPQSLLIPKKFAQFHCTDQYKKHYAAMSLRWGAHLSSATGSPTYDQTTTSSYENSYSKGKIQNPR